MRQLWDGYLDYYGHAPGLRAHLTIVDQWTGHVTRWLYDDALRLADEAFLLLNRLSIMAGDPQEHHKRWLSLLKRGAS